MAGGRWSRSTYQRRSMAMTTRNEPSAKRAEIEALSQSDRGFLKTLVKESLLQVLAGEITAALEVSNGERDPRSLWHG